MFDLQLFSGFFLSYFVYLLYEAQICLIHRRWVMIRTLRIFCLILFLLSLIVLQMMNAILIVISISFDRNVDQYSEDLS
ncbi:hypothetical protein DAI22_03g387900 [Oryza sativa Japonica Group]|nr:hypothetical protein DAI22_03g387900 [Oryza sativa Japonica Group]